MQYLEPTTSIGFVGVDSILGVLLMLEKAKIQLSAELVSVQQVAKMLNCSTRHVYRMSDAGRMPKPVKLGSLVRYNKAAVQKWIDGGCKSCRKGA